MSLSDTFESPHFSPFAVSLLLTPLLPLTHARTLVNSIKGHALLSLNIYENIDGFNWEGGSKQN